MTDEEQFASIFKQVLKAEEVANEQRLLQRFIAGRITHDDYLLLNQRGQTLYKAMHGYRPACESEVKGILRKQNKKAVSRKAEKQGRKTARKGR